MLVSTTSMFSYVSHIIIGSSYLANDIIEPKDRSLSNIKYHRQIHQMLSHNYNHAII